MDFELAFRNGLLQQILTNEVQKHMDKAAQSRGYDNIFTAIGYLNSTNEQFRSEAVAFNGWRDAVWVKCHQMLAEFEAGSRPMPRSVDEVLAELPELKI